MIIKKRFIFVFIFIIILIFLITDVTNKNKDEIVKLEHGGISWVNGNGIVYTYQMGEIKRSTDEGATWTKIKDFGAAKSTWTGISLSNFDSDGWCL